MSSTNIVKACAAGSGKTYYLCEKAIDLIKNGKRVLIVTYTNNGALSIKKTYKKLNSGVIDKNCFVETWYSFLLREIIKPYQSTFLGKINLIKSISFENMYGTRSINFNKNTSIERYMDKNKDVRANETSKLACNVLEASKGMALSRLRQSFDAIMFDEVQDMTGQDLGIFDVLIKSDIDCYFAGDNKQATFKTHNTKQNKKKSGVNIWDFFSIYEKNKMVTIIYENGTRRCNQEICDFANYCYPQNSIFSLNNKKTSFDGVYIFDFDNFDKYYQNCLEKPQILIYDSKTKINYQSMNFGVCKGLTFDRVGIIANGPFEKMLCGEYLENPEKYYIAITRARYSIAICLKKVDKIKNATQTEIDFNGVKIPCYKWTIPKNFKQSL